MDTEDGWRVMQNPLVNTEQLPESDPQLYFMAPNLEKHSNDIGKDFLNNDEEFRIRVDDSKDANNKADILHTDSLPVASSLIAAAPSKIKKEIPESPLRIVKPPKSFEQNAMRKPSVIRHNELYVPYLPQKLIREPLMDRIPYYDMLPQNSYQSLSHSEDPIYLPSYDFQTTPKILPYRQMPILDNSVEYYEIDKNARPIILKEEISYENTPFVPHRFPFMPQKINFPSGNMFPKPYFKPLPISVKARKIVRSPKRSIVSFGRSSRGIPIVRGRFRV